MFAVFETGGRQYKVRIGDEIRIEKLSGEKDSQVSFDRVLLYSKDDELITGKPFIEGGQVKGTILRQDRDKKMIIFKHRPRKGSNRKKGHRQPFTMVRITEIVAS